MIYLIESGDYYKIGYTTNINQRLKSYITANPNFKLIETKEGSKQDEKELHRLCKEFKFKNEWFHKTEKLLEIWDNFIPSNNISIKKSSYFVVFTENEKILYQLKHRNSRPILIWLCCYMESNCNKIKLTSDLRTQLRLDLDISNNTVTNCLKELKELELLFGDKGNYIVNPFVFWKGELNCRNKFIEQNFEIS